jgi:hypothetical protein
MVYVEPKGRFITIPQKAAPRGISATLMSLPAILRSSVEEPGRRYRFLSMSILDRLHVLEVLSEISARCTSARSSLNRAPAKLRQTALGL